MVQLGKPRVKEPKEPKGSQEGGGPPPQGGGPPPGLTVLDVEQLEHSVCEESPVKTRTAFDPARDGRLHRVTELTIDIGEAASDRFKATVLIFFALAFLSCVVFLVVYKVYRYDQACPGGFIVKHNRCVPGGAVHSGGGAGSLDARFYSLVAHSAHSRSTLPRSVSPWIASLFTHSRQHNGAG
ncbi:neuronal vesicle trafficking-associated protein 1-like [Lethenteron reissneri]|uniref:neuronal vesicle trafficking-associated protein 1-like n=1 Tax=Lethenteron reissneri TaxID=7753 RepID=UPI002AB71596|nr:neuronal vesicle trafficking-associated protein 1-like [Lethenteron reissneri]